jgi:hypothetical protein
VSLEILKKTIFINGRVFTVRMTFMMIRLMRGIAQALSQYSQSATQDLDVGPLIALGIAPI